MARIKLDEKDVKAARDGKFFRKQERPPTFSTGCMLLNEVLCGGWAIGRTLNLVGDSQTGKTLIAEEAAACFMEAFPGSPVVYADIEERFDKEYARALGIPVDKITFTNDSDDTDIGTVEDLCQDVMDRYKAAKVGGHLLYIVDSLDALSDNAEMEAEEGTATYGMAKAKAMSRLFRKLKKIGAKKGFTLLIISQVRTKVGVVFGKKETRAGGKALDFYASQIVWLDHLKRLIKTRNKAKRAVGVLVNAECTKNIGPPFRDCTFPVYFNFGIDDVEAACLWLVENNQHKPLFENQAACKKVGDSVFAMSRDEWGTWRRKLGKRVKKGWAAVEADFIRPTGRKYSG